MKPAAAFPLLLLLLLLCPAAAPAREEGKADPPPVEFNVGDLVDQVPRRSGVRQVFASSYEWDRDLQPRGGTTFEFPVDDPEVGRHPLVEADHLAYIVGCLVGDGNRVGRVTEDSVYLVPAAMGHAGGKALARLRALRPATVVAYSLEEEIDGAWRPFLAGAEPVTAGIHTVFADAEERSVLGDYDVELAQDSAVADPIVSTLRTGASLEVLFAPLPGGRSAVVEAIATRSSALPGETAEPGLPGMAPIDRYAVSMAQAAVVFRTGPGEEAVHAWRGRDGRAFRLRLTFSWEPPPPDAGQGALLWSVLFHRAPPHRRHVGHLLRPYGAELEFPWERFGREEEVFAASAEDRFERALASLGGGVDCIEEAESDGGLLLLGGPGARVVGAAVTREMEEEYLPSFVEVEVRGTGGEQGLLFGASGPFTAGTDVCLLSGERRTYIEDWDVEAAQGSWIPDPNLDSLQTGDFCNLRLVAGEDGVPDAVDVDLQMALFRGFECQDLPVLDAMDRGGGSPSGTAAGPPKRATMRIEKPAVSEARIAGRYPLAADGTATLRRAAPGFLGEGRGIVLTVRVSRWRPPR